MFWTVPISSDSVEIELGAGTAIYSVSTLATRDFGTIVNDLQHGPSVPAVVSPFKVHWHGKTAQFQRRDVLNGFRGEFVLTAATMEWSATEVGFNYVSAPADTSTSMFAILGEEHNGIFF